MTLLPSAVKKLAAMLLLSAVAAYYFAIGPATEAYDGALVVVGWFTLLRAVLDGAVNPSLLAVVNQIREGTLDFILLKPADAQFLISTSKFEVFRLLDIAASLSIITAAFIRS